MSRIQSNPKTIPCLYPGCRYGRIWKAGTTDDVDELMRRICLREQRSEAYYEQTEECPECRGAGIVPFPEIKR